MLLGELSPTFGGMTVDEDDASSVVEVSVDFVARLEFFGSRFCWTMARKSFQQRPRKRDSWSSQNVDGCKQVSTSSSPERLSDFVRPERSNCNKNKTEGAYLYIYSQKKNRFVQQLVIRGKTKTKNKQTINLLYLKKTRGRRGLAYALCVLLSDAIDLLCAAPGRDPTKEEHIREKGISIAVAITTV